MGFVKTLLGLLSALAGFFREKQLIDAGADREIVREVKEVERRVEQAEAVDRAIDPERDERLRGRFDRDRARASGGE